MASGYRLSLWMSCTSLLRSCHFFRPSFCWSAVLGGRAPSPFCLWLVWQLSDAFVAVSYLAPALTDRTLLLLLVLAGMGPVRSKDGFLTLSTWPQVYLLGCTTVWRSSYMNHFGMIDHWLVSAQLFRQHHLPTESHPIVNSSHAIYPYARAMLHAWVNSYNGNFGCTGDLQLFVLASTFRWLPLWLKSSSPNILINLKIFLLQQLPPLAFPWAAMLGSTLVVSSYADPVLRFVLSIFYAGDGDGWSRQANCE